MKVIIVGCGKVGSTIARQLNDEGYDIVVVDVKEEAVTQLTENLDIMGVEGNGATFEVLEEAGAKQADLIIAATAADELNLYCCLVAKCCGVKHSIARVRNPAYTKDIPLVKEHLGLSMVINPEFTAARQMSRLLRYSAAIEIDTFAKGIIELYKIMIPDDSIMSGLKIKDFDNIIKERTKICSVEREDQVFIPKGDFILRAGDKISIIAAPNEISKLFKKVGVISNVTRNVMIVGGGKIGFYLAKLLLDTGVGVKIIERSAKRCTELSELLPNATIIQGDGMDRQMLVDEGINYVDGFASLMDYDEENIMLSLYAKRVSKAKIITKVNRIQFDDIIDELNLGSVVHPKNLTAEYIVSYVRAIQNSFGCNIETLYKMIDNKAEAMEFKVREENAVVERPLQELVLKDNLIIGCINRKGKIIIPCGTDKIKINDTVIVLTTHTGLSDLKDILK